MLLVVGIYDRGVASRKASGVYPVTNCVNEAWVASMIGRAFGVPIFCHIVWDLAIASAWDPYLYLRSLDEPCKAINTSHIERRSDRAP